MTSAPIGERPETSRRFWRALALTIAIVGLPAFLAHAAGRYLAGRLAEVQRERILLAMRRQGLAIAPVADAESVLKPVLDRLVRRADRAADPAAWLRPRLVEWHRRRPKLFTFMVLDEHGRLQYQVGGRESRVVTERVWRYLSRLRSGRRPPFADYRVMLEAFFGLGPLSYKLPGRLGIRWMMLSERLRRSWFYSHLHPRFSMLVMMHREGFVPGDLLRDLVRRQSPSSSRRVFAVDGDEMRVFSPFGDLANARAGQVAARFDQEPRPFLADDGWLYATTQVDARWRLLVARLDPQPGRERQFRDLFLFMLLVGGLLGFWIVDRFIVAARPPRVAIRVKLLAFVLLATVMPLLALGVLSSAYITERRSLLIAETVRRAEDRLRALDARFNHPGRSIERALRRVVGGVQVRSEADRNRLLARLESFMVRHLCRGCEVVTSGQPAVHLPRRNQARDYVKRLVHPLLQRVWDRVFPPELAVPRFGRSIEADLAFSLVAADGGDHMIDEISANLGRIMPIDLGTFRGYVCFEVVGQRTATGALLLSMQWDRPDLVRLFRNEAVPGQLLEDGARLLAIDLEARRRVPDPHAERDRLRPWRRFTQQPLHGYYPPWVLTRSEQRFCLEGLRDRRSRYQSMSGPNGAQLAVAWPGELVREVLWVSFAPVAPIERTVAALRWQLQLAGICSLLFAVTLSTWLTGKLLGPVRALADGVAAVEARRFRHRVPEQDPDELGDLSRLFNRMIESLGEVNMGRSVQERLFPSAPLRRGRFTVYGRSRPASELGGDFVDYLPSGDRHIMAVLGDATGHGVPAALMVAMAKALCLHCVRRGDGAVGFINALSGVVFDATRKSAMMMTLSVFWLDAESGHATLINCGHPDTLWWQGPGEVCPVRGPGRLVGWSAVPELSPVELPLAVGQRLIVFTDGLVETVPGDGYVALQTWLSGQPWWSVEETARQMLVWHPGIAGDRPPDDDCSVLIIERTV